MWIGYKFYLLIHPLQLACIPTLERMCIPYIVVPYDK